MGQKNQKDALFFQFFTKKSLLSCSYFVKKRPFSQKLCALISFFSFFYEKLPALMPIIGQKNVNSVNTTLYYGPKKLVSRKNQCSHAHIVKKLPFSKKHTAPVPIFCQKNVHSLKNVVFSCHFFSNITWKTLPSRPYLVKKTSILLKLQYIMGQKTQ